MTGNEKGVSEIPIFEIENGPFNMISIYCQINSLFFVPCDDVTLFTLPL